MLIAAYAFDGKWSDLIGNWRENIVLVNLNLFDCMIFGVVFQQKSTPFKYQFVSSIPVETMLIKNR